MDGYDPSVSLSENFQCFCRSGFVSDEAHTNSDVPASRTQLTPFSLLSEGGNTDSVHSGSGVSFTAQQYSFAGSNNFEGSDLPYSPIPEVTHPWDESQQQLYNSTTAETKGSSPDDLKSHSHCETCNESFASNNSLKRHVETVHDRDKTYWVCTVKGCGKYERPVFRKDNFRRHCKKKHPTVNLKQFGL